MAPSGTIESLVLKQSSKAIVQAFERFANRNTAAFIAARDELFRDWVVEVQRALNDVLPALFAHVQDLEARLDAQAQDPQLGRILDNLGDQASREAIDERRRMLAHAAAGIIDPELTIAEKARIERVLRELDPSDVLALCELSMLNDIPEPEGASESTNYEQWKASAVRSARYAHWHDSGSADVLLASGCVRVTSESALTSDWYYVDVTPMGQRVLSVLMSYIRATRDPLETTPTPEQHDNT